MRDLQTPMKLSKIPSLENKRNRLNQASLHRLVIDPRNNNEISNVVEFVEMPNLMNHALQNNVSILQHASNRVSPISSLRSYREETKG